MCFTIGGGSTGWSWFSFPFSAHTRLCTKISPGVVIVSNARNVLVKISCWVCLSPTCPKVRPKGYSMAEIRGTFTDTATSGMGVCMIVENPAVSNSRCTSPTDQQQIGQAGASRTTSTRSCFKSAMIAGTVSFNCCSGSKI